MQGRYFPRRLPLGHLLLLGSRVRRLWGCAVKFVLSIRLGNDAMQAQDDIAQALITLGKQLRDWSYERTPEIGDVGAIKDINGNRVGGWHVE